MRNEQTFRLNLLASAVRGAFRRPLDLALLVAAAPSLVFAGPDGGAVVAGSATITNPTLDGTQIHQTSQQAILNWQNFSIGSSEYVQFQQPNSSAVALNRVVGGNPSSILGSLSANGQVFLVNPHGVFFGQGAAVDVAGLVATTMAISDNDFLSGNYVFTAPAGAGAAGQVVNQGVINANGGYVVLAGDYTANSGVIQARLGTVVLASGAGMTMDLAGDGLINLAVDEKTVSSLAGVENSGQIIANGGAVIMTARVADGLIGAAVNNSGQIQAQGVVEQGGEIYLVADGGDVENSGLLDASGATDGGTVKLVSSHDVVVAAGAAIKADGGAAGAGGDIRLIAKNFLDFQDGASVSVTGGESGGLVEVSGHGGIRVAGDVALGAGGKYFIDPPTVTVTGGANLGAINTVYEADIEGQLNDGTDVFIVAAVTSGASAGASASVLFRQAADGGEGFTDFTDGLNASGSGGLFIGVGREFGGGGLFGQITHVRNAVGDIDLAGVRINIAGDLQLIAGSLEGDITLRSLGSAGAPNLVAKSIKVDAGRVLAPEVIALRSTTGVIEVTGDVLVGNAARVAMGLGAGPVNGALISLVGQTSVTVTGNLESSISSSAGGNDQAGVRVQSITSTVDIDGNVTATVSGPPAADASIDIAAAGDVTTQALTAQATALSADADASIDINAGGALTVGTLQAIATAGTSAFASASASIDLFASDDIVTGALTVTANAQAAASGEGSGDLEVTSQTGGITINGDLTLEVRAHGYIGTVEARLETGSSGSTAGGDITVNGNAQVLTLGSYASAELRMIANSDGAGYGGDITITGDAIAKASWQSGSTSSDNTATVELTSRAGSITVSGEVLAFASHQNGESANASIDISAGAAVSVQNVTAQALTEGSSSASASINIDAGTNVTTLALTALATASYSDASASIDVSASGDVTINGALTVTATGGTGTSASADAEGDIFAGGSITVTGPIQVRANAPGGSSASASLSMSAGADITVGDIEVTAVALNSSASASLSFSAGGNITAGDLSVSAIALNSSASASIDISASDSISVASLTVTASGDTASGEASGFLSLDGDDIDVTGPVSVFAQGGIAVGDVVRAEAVFNASGSLTLGDAIEVSAVGGNSLEAAGAFVNLTAGTDSCCAELQVNGAVTATFAGAYGNAAINLVNQASYGVFVEGDLTVNWSGYGGEAGVHIDADGGTVQVDGEVNITLDSIGGSSAIDGHYIVGGESSPNQVNQNGAVNVTVNAANGEARVELYVNNGNLAVANTVTVRENGNRVVSSGSTSGSSSSSSGFTAKFIARASGDIELAAVTVTELGELAHALIDVDARGDLVANGPLTATAGAEEEGNNSSALAEVYLAAGADGEGNLTLTGDLSVSAVNTSSIGSAEANVELSAFGNFGYGGSIFQDGDVEVTAVGSEANFSAFAYGGDFVANGNTTVSAEALGYGGAADARYQAGAFGSGGYGGSIFQDGDVTVTAVNTYGGSSSFVAFTADQAIQGNGLVSADELDINVEGGGSATVDLRTKARDIEVGTVADLAIDNFAEKDPVFLAISGGLAGGIDFETGGDLEADISVEMNGDAFIGAAGDFEASGVQIFTNGTIDLVAGGDLDVSNTELFAGEYGGVFLAAGGDVYSGAYGGADIGGGMVGVFAGGDVLLGDSTVNVGDHTDPSRHAGDVLIVDFLNANLPFVDAETEEEFNFPPQSSTPNAFFIAQGSGEAEGVVAINQINMDGDYLWLQGNIVELGGWSGPSTILAQILPSGAASFNVEQDEGDLQGVVYSYNDLFNRFGETTFALGASFLPFNVIIGSNGTIEFGDANVIIGTNGSVTGLGNIITDGLVAVVGLRVLSANEIGAAGDLLDNNYGEDDEDDEEDENAEAEAEEEGGGGGGLVEEEEAGEDNLECT